MKYSKEEKQESLESLKEWIKKGDILHTTVNHVSRSGMMRHMSVKHLKATDNPERPVNVSNYDYQIARVLDLPEAPDYQGVKVGGCGMDMGFHLVYTLSRKLFDDGYAIKQEWL